MVVEEKRGINLLIPADLHFYLLFVKFCYLKSFINYFTTPKMISWNFYTFKSFKNINILFSKEYLTSWTDKDWNQDNIHTP